MNIKHWPLISTFNLSEHIHIKEKFCIKCKNHPLWLEFLEFILLIPFMFILIGVVFIGSCIYEVISNKWVWLFVVFLAGLFYFLDFELKKEALNFALLVKK